jgi:hypothetical protein
LNWMILHTFYNYNKTLQHRKYKSNAVPVIEKRLWKPIPESTEPCIAGLSEPSVSNSILDLGDYRSGSTINEFPRARQGRRCRSDWEGASFSKLR